MFRGKEEEAQWKLNVRGGEKNRQSTVAEVEEEVKNGNMRQGGQEGEAG